MNKITKNYLYNVVYQVLIIIIPLITAPYISRVLGPEPLGIHSYTYSVASYFLMFAMLGVANYGNRSIARVRDDKTKLSNAFFSIYGLQCFTASMATVCYVIYIIFIDNRYIDIALLQTIYVLSGLFDISWFFFGLEEFKITVTRNIVIRVLSLVLIFLFVKTEADLWKYTLIVVGSAFFPQIYLWKYIRTYIDCVVFPGFRSIFKNLIPEITLFIPAIAVNVYKVMDKIMLGNMSTIEQVGYYQNAEKIVVIPMGVITALGTVMLPRMTNIYQNKQETRAQKYMETSMLFAMWLSFAMMFGLAGIAKEFVPIFLGEKYVESGNILFILAFTIFFMSWANVIRTQYLIPKGKDKQYIVSVCFGAVVNLAVNYLLIPKFGAVGAAYATVLAEASVCIVQTVYTLKDIDTLKYIRIGIPFLCIGLIMFISMKAVGAVVGVGEVFRVILMFLTGFSIYVGGSIVLIIMKPLAFGVLGNEIKVVLKRGKRHDSNKE